MGGYLVKFGWVIGGMINIIIKSGINEWEFFVVV